MIVKKKYEILESGLRCSWNGFEWRVLNGLDAGSDALFVITLCSVATSCLTDPQGRAHVEEIDGNLVQELVSQARITMSPQQ
jgi:hypothetical protein